MNKSRFYRETAKNTRKLIVETRREWRENVDGFKITRSCRNRARLKTILANCRNEYCENIITICSSNDFHSVPMYLPIRHILIY